MTEREKACVAFFHGKDIPTERIAEGGFWEMVELLEQINIYGDGLMQRKFEPGSHTVTKLVSQCRSLLAKLGVEPNEDRR